MTEPLPTPTLYQNTAELLAAEHKLSHAHRRQVPVTLTAAQASALRATMDALRLQAETAGRNGYAEGARDGQRAERKLLTNYGREGVVEQALTKAIEELGP